jgi:single-stranded DNA-binding protein
MSVNKVILMGHTGKAPDFRQRGLRGDLFVGNHETRLYHKGRAANPGAYRMA